MPDVRAASEMGAEAMKFKIGKHYRYSEKRGWQARCDDCQSWTGMSHLWLVDPEERGKYNVPEDRLPKVCETCLNSKGRTVGT